MSGKRNLELYFHIPFCVRKCNYCDFLSFSCDEKTKASYMDALFREVREKAGNYTDYQVVSVFVGGGTPSVVSERDMAALLSVVRECFALLEDAEITIEVNPGTVTLEKLRVYQSAGFNRLSIGLQSANDGELRQIGRIHTYRQFLDTYGWALDAGFDNINVDIMSALPGQSFASYVSTLSKLVSLPKPPVHISAYSLILEEGTVLMDRFERGELILPDEETDRAMYEETKRILEEHGYHRYEISNYALPGFECRHNVGYWTRTDYVGFGIGAASLVGEVRFHNDADLEDYLKNPSRREVDREELTIEQQMEETMFLGLRLTAGVDRAAFQTRFDVTVEQVYGTVINTNIRDGLLRYSDDGERLCLTEKGLNVSNYVMAQFIF
ncbi:MAG: radical SAM family heme chaperone HemW [Acetatifactor sp.]